MKNAQTRTLVATNMSLRKTWHLGENVVVLLGRILKQPRLTQLEYITRLLITSCTDKKIACLAQGVMKVSVWWEELSRVEEKKCSPQSLQLADAGVDANVEVSVEPELPAKWSP